MTRDPTDARDADGRERRRERLLLDAMLGKLATYLRMCGYDAAYALDRGIEDDEEVVQLARAEDRLVLTRDRSLADRVAAESKRERGDGFGSVLLSEREVTGQLRELQTAGFDLSLVDPPTRCGRCNGRLERPEAIESRPEYVPDGETAWRCRDCEQWFWKGSHWDDVAARLEAVRGG